MKPFIQCSSFLAVITAAALLCFYNINKDSTANGSGSSSNTSRSLIVKKWAIPEPRLEFRRGDNVVILNYDSINNNNNNDNNNNDIDGSSAIISSSVSLWSKECKSGGGTEIKLRDDNGDDIAVVTVENNRDFSVAVVGIDLDRLWSDLRNTKNDNLGSSSSTVRSIEVCVRYALSANRDITTSQNNENNKDKSNEETKPLEMNFVESVILATLETSGKKQPPPQQHHEEDDPSVFGVATATLAPTPQQHHRQPQPQRWEQTFYHNYTIEAFFCPGGEDNTPIMKVLRQGSVITLCVQPSKKDAGNIRVSSIEDFTWTKRRTKPSISPPPTVVVTTTTFNNSTSTSNNSQSVTVEKRHNHHHDNSNDNGNDNVNDDGSIIARQEAIRDGTAFDMFTVYDGCGGSFCSFSSLLRTDFYTAVEAKVSGSGSMSLEFGTPNSDDATQ